MAWIRGNKLINIVESSSLIGAVKKVNQKMEQGWKQASSIQQNGCVYACLITRDIKVRR